MTDAALDRLRNALTNAYDDLPRAREIAERAGVPRDVQPIDQPNMRGWWWETLHIAWGRRALVKLVETAMADPTAAGLTATFEGLRDPVAQLQAQPAPRPGGTAGSDDTEKLIRQIDLLLGDTKTAVHALDRLGRDLRDQLAGYVTIEAGLEDEVIYARYYEEMHQPEKELLERMCFITQGSLHDGNQALYELLTAHPELIQAIPLLGDLRGHLKYWLGKFDAYMRKYKRVPVVFTGQRDGVPFPGKVDPAIKTWLATHAADGSPGATDA